MNFKRRSSRFFQVAEIEGWINDVCQALEYAHSEMQMVHHDLKPANIIVGTSTGRAKVLDFGISRRIAESHTMLTGGDVYGTPTYCSIQQLNGECGRATDDVYALGATIYELLTGAPPFFRSDIKEQLKTVIPPLMIDRRRELADENLVLAGGADIPVDWETTISACLEKQVEDRLQSAVNVAEMLAGQATIHRGTATARLNVSAPMPTVKLNRTQALQPSTTGSLVQSQSVQSILAKRQSPARGRRKILVTSLVVGAVTLLVVFVNWKSGANKEAEALTEVKDRLVAIEREVDGSLDAARLYKLGEELQTIKERHPELDWADELRERVKELSARLPTQQDVVEQEVENDGNQTDDIGDTNFSAGGHFGVE